MMSRVLVNFWLDFILFVIMLALIWTSCLLQLVFPPATAARGWNLWGMSYDGWSTMQFALLCAIVFAILVHVMMHWNWVCTIISTRLLRRSGKPDEGIQTLYGVSTLMLLMITLGALLLAAQLCIHSPTP